MANSFDPTLWASVPFEFWAGVFFLFGALVGSFLNVCIYRMPLEQSLITPASHCPSCGKPIPWYLNIPLLTWLHLRGRCARCGARISPRYFLVELLAAGLFFSCWWVFGERSPGLALAYCLFVSGLIVATFIDLEHYIIPDEITYGGMVAGLILSLVLPALHGVSSLAAGLKESLLGLGVGAGLVYAILRLGKVMFGRHKLELAADTRVVFTETALVLPDQTLPYEELFYRKSDCIVLEGRYVELVDRGYKDVRVRLSPEKLWIGEEELDPEQTPHLEVVATQIVLPREAMGLGDVKFMAGIGAFLGWKATLYSLMISSVIGALVGLTLVLMRKHEWSGRLPYGPYIALAAVTWVFGGSRLWAWLFPGF